MKRSKNLLIGLKVLMILSLFFIGTQNFFAQNSSGTLPKHDQIEEQYTWNLKDIYESEDLWEKDFLEIEKTLPEYQKFVGKVGASAQNLYDLLKFDEKISITLDKLSLYASLAKDLDLSNSKYLAMADRVSSLSSKVAAAGSFIRPELVAIPKETLEKYFSQLKELQIYRQMFDNLYRTKSHTLSPEVENVLALAYPLMETPSNTFSLFTGADIQYPTIVGENNQGEIKLSAGRYTAGLYSTDRAYRERVYKGFYKPYMEYENTLLSSFTGNIKALMFNAKARKYKNTREASLDPNNIPLSVYDNLVNTVNANLKVLHRWCDLKKKILKLEDFHPYDTYVTLFPAVKKTYPYPTGKELVINALKPLGEEYQKALNMAFNNRWIDVYETENKRSGAYSSDDAYGVHPYVLLNYNDELSDVFTLAHEMGHNMHSYFTVTTQPFPYANYSIFVAEVASTANEAFLLDYLIQNATTKEEKLALIEKELNKITTTFFRQTRFAEFEQFVNEQMEAGVALTPEFLTKSYIDLYQKYWGPSMITDIEEGYTWARIPHFYYNFYVYQYATSYAASQAIFEKIKKEGQPAIDKFLTFLKSGSSKYPIEVLKDAGVDMNSPEPIIAVVNRMNLLMDEMEKLLNEK
jgi:oligoendopeptidase F